MFEEKSERDHRAVDVTLACHVIERFAKFEPFGVIWIGEFNVGVADKTTAAQRTPRHRTDILREALVERAVRKSIEMQQTDLHLVRDQFHRQMLLHHRKETR